MIYFSLEGVTGTRIKIENSSGTFPSVGVSCLYIVLRRSEPLLLNQMCFKINDAELEAMKTGVG